MARKYRKEIHANEIVLMAYYIASINIENVFHSLMPEESYTAFDGICLTDTFQLSEETSIEKTYSEQFPANLKRVIEQRDKPITVIIGNPPYSVGQRSANDNAQNQKYPRLDSRIEQTYVKGTNATNRKSLYDSYIKAFRRASDRLDKSGGIIGFVTNGSWIDGNSQDGMRKCLEREFSSIYVFNLRGNCRTSGDLRRKEGDGILGLGSRTPIAITILVKKGGQKAKIHYYDIGDYLSREDKLGKIRGFGSIENIPWREITPNEHGDWINHRNELFKKFIQLGNKDDKRDKKTFFVPYYSNGLKTQRDHWCYNSSLAIVQAKAKEQIDYYNETREKLNRKEIKDVDYSTSQISWTRSVISEIQRNAIYNLQQCEYRESIYRPYFKQWLLFYKPLNEMRYQIPKLFSTPEHRNLVICVSGIGVTKDFSCIITDILPDLELIGKSQCFPLYWYDDSIACMPGLLFPQDTNRKDGITDWILGTARKQYGFKVIKEDIFYYVYGLLHSPEYRTAFATDLKKSLPRLPLVEKAKDFWAFGKADSKAADKSIIHYNHAIAIEDIPAEAYEYVVNGKPAIEWIMERYAITTDKKSGITNDPNDWAREHNDEKYILNLLLRVIHASVQTVEIVKGLPELKFEI